MKENLIQNLGSAIYHLNKSAEIRKELKAYYKACQDLADKFVDKYYKQIDFEWEGRAGSCLYINDYWWSMSDIINALELNMPADKLFEYYDLRLEAGMKKKGFQNMKSFLKYGVIK